MRAVLAIAGLDSSGGAGFAADVATITCLGFHAKAVATAITAQSLEGIQRVEPLDPILVRDQIACAFEDLRPAAVKVGMLANDDIASEVARTLRDVGARNVVVDPVLRSTSGTSLMEPGAGLAELLRLCRLATPNVPEALRLCGGAHASEEDGPDRMSELAGMLTSEYGCAFLVKGGHLGLSRDCLAWREGSSWIGVPPVAGAHAHGTGCVLSSAIACGLADGADLQEAVLAAKRFLRDALAARQELGSTAYLGMPEAHVPGGRA